MTATPSRPSHAEIATADRRSRAEMATLGAILLVAFAALARSAGSPWLFDVGDWNGALWSVFARNFLRYGYAPLKLGQAYFAGPLPADVTYYTHHSVFITVILTEIYRLFGVHESVARLAASAVTVLTAAMTYVLAREQFDSRTALFATLTIALAPLTLVYGRMYNHEVFALFWVVTSTWAYLRWTKTRTPRDLARLGVCVFLAALTAWPGYYLVVLLPLHHRFAFPHSRDGRTLTRMLIGIALAAFGIYIAHGYWLKGSTLFVELKNSCERGWFYDRVDWGDTFTTRDFIRTELQRSVTWFTAPLLVLAAVGVGCAVGQMILLRRVDAAHGAILMLLLFGASHLPLFKQETMGHEYYLYYLLPGVALAAGLAMREMSAAHVAVPWRVGTLSTIIVAFVVASVATTLPVDRARTPDREFYRELGLWMKDNTAFTDHVLLNFHVEGPFLMYYADRDVVESVSSLTRVRAEQRPNTVLVMRLGLTPHLERAVLRRYGATTVTSDGELVSIARVSPRRDDRNVSVNAR